MLDLAKLLEKAGAVGAAARPRALAVVAWAWRNREAVLAALVVIFVALYFHAYGRASRAENQVAAATARAAEEAKARQADVPVVQVAPQPVVNEEAERALAERPELLAERDRLKKEIGKLRAILVLRGSTAPIAAVGPVRPGEPAAAPAPEQLPPVLLRVGDRLRLTLGGVAVEGEQGAQALLLEVAALRDADGAELGSAPLSVQLSSFLAPPSVCPGAEAPRRWHAGPVGGGAGGTGGVGWLVGAGATRLLDVWGWKPEVMVSAAGGPGGAVVLGGFLF